VVEEETEKCRGKNKEFDSEGVVVAVVGRFKLLVYHPYGRGGRSDEEDFHCGVVEGDEAGEEIEITGAKDDEEENLCLPGNSSTAARLPDL